MTDILKRLNTVVTYAEHGVDPYWVEIAITEIERLRGLIEDFCFADVGEIDCDCPLGECECEVQDHRDATMRLHHAADTWMTQGDAK